MFLKGGFARNTLPVMERNIVQKGDNKMSTLNLLTKEIESEFEKLEDIEVGTDEYKTTVDGITKLVDRAIDYEKLKNEQSREAVQMDEERKDRIVKNGIAVAGIAIPSLITIWGTIKSIQFEKEGTITTFAGRSFFNKLFSKK